MKTANSIPLSIDSLQLKEAAFHIRSLNHKLRKRILEVIHENGRMSANDIYSTLNIPAEIGFQHLAVLRKHRYITIHIDYTHVFYTVNYSRIKDVQEISKKLSQKMQLRRLEIRG